MGQAFEEGYVEPVAEVDEMTPLPEECHHESVASPNSPEMRASNVFRGEVSQDDEKIMGSHSIYSNAPVTQSHGYLPEKPDTMVSIGESDEDSPSSSLGPLLTSSSIRSPPTYTSAHSDVEEIDEATWSLSASRRQNVAPEHVAVASGNLDRTDDVVDTSAANGIEPEDDDHDLDNRSEAIDMSSDDEGSYPYSSHREIPQNLNCLSAPHSIPQVSVNRKHTWEDEFIESQASYNGPPQAVTPASRTLFSY